MTRRKDHKKLKLRIEYRMCDVWSHNRDLPPGTRKGIRRMCVGFLVERTLFITDRTIGSIAGAEMNLSHLRKVIENTPGIRRCLLLGASLGAVDVEANDTFDERGGQYAVAADDIRKIVKAIEAKKNLELKVIPDDIAWWAEKASEACKQFLCAQATTAPLLRDLEVLRHGEYIPDKKAIKYILTSNGTLLLHTVVNELCWENFGHQYRQSQPSNSRTKIREAMAVEGITNEPVYVYPQDTYISLERLRSVIKRRPQPLIRDGLLVEITPLLQAEVLLYVTQLYEDCNKYLVMLNEDGSTHDMYKVQADNNKRPRLNPISRANSVVCAAFDEPPAAPVAPVEKSKEFEQPPNLLGRRLDKVETKILEHEAHLEKLLSMVNLLSSREVLTEHKKRPKCSRLGYQEHLNPRESRGKALRLNIEIIERIAEMSLTIQTKKDVNGNPSWNKDQLPTFNRIVDGLARLGMSTFDVLRDGSLQVDNTHMDLEIPITTYDKLYEELSMVMLGYTHPTAGDEYG